MTTTNAPVTVEPTAPPSFTKAEKTAIMQYLFDPTRAQRFDTLVLKAEGVVGKYLEQRAVTEPNQVWKFGTDGEMSPVYTGRGGISSYPDMKWNLSLVYFGDGKINFDKLGSSVFEINTPEAPNLSFFAPVAGSAWQVSFKNLYGYPTVAGSPSSLQAYKDFDNDALDALNQAMTKEFGSDWNN